MFCRECGAQNDDGARFCTKCGKNFEEETVSLAVEETKNDFEKNVEVKNYLTPAIISTICCCVPFGVPAIIYAAKVKTLLEAGKVPEAIAASKKAKNWCLAAFLCGGIWVILYAIITMINVVNSAGY